MKMDLKEKNYHKNLVIVRTDQENLKILCIQYTFYKKYRITLHNN